MAPNGPPPNLPVVPPLRPGGESGESPPNASGGGQQRPLPPNRPRKETPFSDGLEPTIERGEEKGPPVLGGDINAVSRRPGLSQVNPAIPLPQGGRPAEVPPPPRAPDMPALTMPPAAPPGARRTVRGRRLAIVLVLAGGFVLGVVLLVVALFRGGGRTAVEPGDQSGAVETPATRNVPPPQTDQQDSDGDGLSNAEEVALGSDPTRTDTDGDGATDRAEVDAGLNPHGAGLLDRDGDELPDRDEAALGTDPRNGDTDGDGYLDGNEVHHCYDPRVPSPQDKIRACPPYPGLAVP